MPGWRYGLWLAGIVLPAALAGAQPAAARSDPADQMVIDVGYRIAVKAGDLCPDPAPALGFTVQDLSQFAGADRRRAIAQFALGDTPQILAVAHGSVAERAGLMAGDDIVSAGGRAMPPMPKEAGTFDRVAQTLDLLDQAAAGGALTLVVRRDGEQRTLVLHLVEGCRSRFVVNVSRGLNSQADGEYVEVDTSLVAFARSEEQLAVVVAHEMAHNILGHRRRLAAERTIRGRRGRIAETRRTEDEADRYGVYLLDRAGFPPQAAAAFWARYGARRARLIHDGSHAPPAERVAMIEREIARLEAMKAGGQVPHPDFGSAPQSDAAR